MCNVLHQTNRSGTFKDFLLFQISSGISAFLRTQLTSADGQASYVTGALG